MAADFKAWWICLIITLGPSGNDQPTWVYNLAIVLFGSVKGTRGGPAWCLDTYARFLDY